jgi:alcohol dehydrogenase (cytochrome c)
MRMQTIVLVLGGLGLGGVPAVAGAQSVDPGHRIFDTRCARCHGGDANGGEMGPPIRERLTTHDNPQLAKMIHEGLPAKGMPPSDLGDSDTGDLVAFLRSVERRPEAAPVVRLKLQTTDGKYLEGQVMGEGFADLQLMTDDKRVHLLRREKDRVREVSSQSDWPGYNGEPGGNRYTRLTQIDKTNVARLAPRWVFTIPGAGQSQTTPSVVGGIMYISNPNECFAVDAGTGRKIWQYRRPRTTGATSGHANRGVAIAGDRLFMETDNAHVIALNRHTGELLWDTELADWKKN